MGKAKKSKKKPKKRSGAKAGIKLSSEGKVCLKSLRFRAWEDDHFIKGILERRGWKYEGEPIKRGMYTYPKSMFNARKSKRLDRKTCLFWGDDYCGEALAGYRRHHLVNVIPATRLALTKSSMQNMWGKYPWFPQCFSMPKEKSELQEAIDSSKGDSYWICKPPDAFGGKGLTVYKAGSAEFKRFIRKRSTGVVQRYLHNPYLIGGYKFHIRAFMLISSREPLKAYLYKDGQIKFATVEYDLNSVGKKFNKYQHLTNKKVNKEKQNIKNVYKDKPEVGIGADWPTYKFFNWLDDNEPKFKGEAAFWKELAKMSKIMSKSMMEHEEVKKACKKYHTECHFEVFGLDVMLDDKLNMYVTEANTQPGLGFQNPQYPNKVFNQQIVESNIIVENLVNDIFTKLGADGKTFYEGEWITLW